MPRRVERLDCRRGAEGKGSVSIRLVVLGGSSGLGLATARKALEHGWDVVIASRRPRRADVAAEFVELDVTDEPAVRAFSSGLGPIDHLVSSTALLVNGPSLTVGLEEPHRLFETKVWGPIAAVQAADTRRSVVLMSGASARRGLLLARRSVGFDDPAASRGAGLLRTGIRESRS